MIFVQSDTQFPSKRVFTLRGYGFAAGYSSLGVGYILILGYILYSTAVPPSVTVSPSVTRSPLITAGPTSATVLQSVAISVSKSSKLRSRLTCCRRLYSFAVGGRSFDARYSFALGCNFAVGLSFAVGQQHNKNSKSVTVLPSATLSLVRYTFAAGYTFAVGYSLAVGTNSGVGETLQIHHYWTIGLRIILGSFRTCRIIVRRVGKNKVRPL